MTLGAAASAADRTIIEFPAQGLQSAGRLVLGGVASRFELPIDRIDDLLLAVESLLLQESAGDTMRIEAQATATGLIVRVGPFSNGRLESAGLRRVLQRLVDELDETTSDGGSMLELVVSAAHRTDTA